ncbi:MAG: hypothetical protein PHE48_02880 [Candidatus Daviesbacteria bacterium]|nr:hypothetical protein [Candidatus Daviesbacteria bacterium]
MRLANTKIVIGLLVLIAVSVAYFFLIYLPKQQEFRLRQQETTLRKQTYELCLKEWNGMYDKAGELFVRENPEITKQELGDKLIPIINKKDEIITNCVEKRLQEYKK